MQACGFLPLGIETRRTQAGSTNPLLECRSRGAARARLPYHRGATSNPSRDKGFAKNYRANSTPWTPHPPAWKPPAPNEANFFFRDRVSFPFKHFGTISPSNCDSNRRRYPVHSLDVSAIRVVISRFFSKRTQPSTSRRRTPSGPACAERTQFRISQFDPGFRRALRTPDKVGSFRAGVSQQAAHSDPEVRRARRGPGSGLSLSHDRIVKERVDRIERRAHERNRLFSVTLRSKLDGLRHNVERGNQSRQLSTKAPRFGGACASGIPVGPDTTLGGVGCSIGLDLPSTVRVGAGSVTGALGTRSADGPGRRVGIGRAECDTTGLGVSAGMGDSPVGAAAATGDSGGFGTSCGSIVAISSAISTEAVSSGSGDLPAPRLRGLREVMVRGR